MQFPTIILSSLALATVSLAAPTLENLSLMKRAVTLYTDDATASITPAVVGGTASLDGVDAGGKADIASAVADIVVKVTDLVQGLIDGDTERRKRFTQETVAAISTQFPGQNVIMSNVDYTLTPNTPTVVQHTSYKAKVGSNVSFDVLVFGAGHTFVLNGDGGFQNWAAISFGCNVDGKTIAC